MPHHQNPEMVCIDKPPGCVNIGSCVLGMHVCVCVSGCSQRERERVRGREYTMCVCVCVCGIGKGVESVRAKVYGYSAQFRVHSVYV